MHEASIVEGLIALVTEKVPAGSKVCEIRVRIGGFSGVSADAMQFYFEVMREESLGSQCRLVTEPVPIRARCKDCGREMEFPEPAWSCPHCSSTSLDFLNGLELDLEAIEIENVTDHPH